ncbi:hypothetical protein PR202_ga17186 [Eleusine coracana subsp. coracana]|uniref:Amino acid transporter transmembrane domain-containing protein n=1 Tax=Eleusine coracana subsp. coracana TaxID=191504 RepID=A0AAV5CQ36_ELECO|nr:hypothetical protein PR202_ga17186 [Eleusine coracana subsp. coracana]
MTMEGSNKHFLKNSEPLLLAKWDVEDRGAGTFHEFDGGSFAGAVFNLSTTIVGAGIMALPATLKVLGLVPGLVMIVLAALLTSPTPPSSCSRLLQVCIIVNNIGALIVYMIIIGDVLSGTSVGGEHHYGVLEGWFGTHWWNGRFFVLLVTTLCVFAPLASFKRIDALSYTSAISVALAVVFVVITAGISIVKLVGGQVPMPMLFPSVPDLASVWELFTVVPVLVTAYGCHYNVHQIHNELKDSSQMESIVHTSLILCSTVYLATSFFGFLLFGESTLSDVLANFDSNLGIPYGSILNDVVRVSYAVHLMLVFPMIFYALRLNLDGLLFSSSARTLSFDNRRFGVMTAILLLVIFLSANFIPSIWDIFQFTGATAAVCFEFIFPAAITLRDPHSIAKKWDKILAVFMIVLAVVSNVVAVYSDTYKMFHKESAPTA